MKYFESNHMANDDFDDLQVRLLKVTPEQETFEFDSETGEIIR